MATIINKIAGEIRFGDKVFRNVKNMIIAEDGSITINGVPVEEYNGEEPNTFKIEITGNVETIESQDADVEVKGNAGNITSKNGNITCKDVTGSVINKNGNIICGSVSGGVTTKNGNIIRNNFN